MLATTWSNLKKLAELEGDYRNFFMVQRYYVIIFNKTENHEKLCFL